MARGFEGRQGKHVASSIFLPIDFFSETNRYHECLTKFIEENDAILTQADRVELQNLYDTQASIAEAYLEEWKLKFNTYMAQ